MNEHERIRFILDYLSKPEHASELNDRQIDLIISFQGQFQRNGSLSEKQVEVLERIWKETA